MYAPVRIGKECRTGVWLATRRGSKHSIHHHYHRHKPKSYHNTQRATKLPLQLEILDMTLSWNANCLAFSKSCRTILWLSKLALKSVLSQAEEGILLYNIEQSRVREDFWYPLVIRSSRIWSSRRSLHQLYQTNHLTQRHRARRGCPINLIEIRKLPSITLKRKGMFWDLVYGDQTSNPSNAFVIMKNPRNTNAPWQCPSLSPLPN